MNESAQLFEADFAAPGASRDVRRKRARLTVEEALARTKLCPYWLDNPAEPPAEPSLAGETRADLLIVGGGFTGLWAAVQAKEQMPELDVVLIEAGRVAHGASGRAGGIISTSVMHGLPNAVRVFRTISPSSKPSASAISTASKRRSNATASTPISNGTAR